MNKVGLISLCQGVMIQGVTLSQAAFVERLFKCLSTTVDPVSRVVLRENAIKLYAFLDTMSSHPMRVALSHAMEGTFLDVMCVPTKDSITSMLKEYNRGYDLELNEDAITSIIESSGCSYSEYHDHT